MWWRGQPLRRAHNRRAAMRQSRAQEFGCASCVILPISSMFAPGTEVCLRSLRRLDMSKGASPAELGSCLNLRLSSFRRSDKIGLLGERRSHGGMDFHFLAQGRIDKRAVRSRTLHFRDDGEDPLGASRQGCCAVPTSRPWLRGRALSRSRLQTPRTALGALALTLPLPT